jgi:hypothetical protein
MRAMAAAHRNGWRTDRPDLRQGHVVLSHPARSDERTPRCAFSLASLVTQGDAVKGSSPGLSLGRPSATSPLEVAVARRPKGAVGGYPLPSQTRCTRHERAFTSRLPAHKHTKRLIMRRVDNGHCQAADHAKPAG